MRHVMYLVAYLNQSWSTALHDRGIEKAAQKQVIYSCETSRIRIHSLSLLLSVMMLHMRFPVRCTGNPALCPTIFRNSRMFSVEEKISIPIEKLDFAYSRSSGPGTHSESFYTVVKICEQSFCFAVQRSLQRYLQLWCTKTITSYLLLAFLPFSYLFQTFLIPFSYFIGGQNVNKLNTKAELRFHVYNADWMSDEVKGRLHSQQANKINNEGELLLTCQEHRYDNRNNVIVTI